MSPFPSHLFSLFDSFSLLFTQTTSHHIIIALRIVNSGTSTGTIVHYSLMCVFTLKESTAALNLLFFCHTPSQLTELERKHKANYWNYKHTFFPRTAAYIQSSMPHGWLTERQREWCDGKDGMAVMRRWRWQKWNSTSLVAVMTQGNLVMYESIHKMVILYSMNIFL